MERHVCMMGYLQMILLLGLPRRHMFEPSKSIVPPNVTKCKAGCAGIPYNGYGTSMAYVELFVTAPDTFKEGDDTDLDEYYDSLGQDVN